MSDGGNWLRNSFWKALEIENNPLRICPPKPLPGNGKSIPHVFVGDDAFRLTAYLTKPYPQIGLTEQKRVFNYRLSRCRRISENGFGILSGECSESLFSCSLCRQLPSPCKLTLRNLLRSETEASQIQHPQDLTEDNGCHTGDNSWLEAKEIRREFTEYVMMEGVVPWQWRSPQLRDDPFHPKCRDLKPYNGAWMVTVWGPSISVEGYS